ncbi:MAG: hypothetical protein HS104_17380 [Polyangiaceae bacterium]|nr:hypothetical protein [Polyangiaceae bacterium]MCE7891675.1 hypothetical protein [Sorangiineae bacterium PRO1]MCL4752142.1 hypothetical protein [Myxococcales bacterium]
MTSPGGCGSRWLGVPRLLLATLCLAAVAGCSEEEEEPGQMVVSVHADMAIPKDFESFGIEVLSGGEQKRFPDPVEIGPGPSQIRLPATLTLVGNSDPSTTATVTVIAYANGKPVTLSRVVTQVPPAKLSLLRLPVQWLCKGKVSGPVELPISTCPEGQSCVNGDCIDDGDHPLTGYGTGDVYGGGDGKNQSGTCFDTVTCLDQGFDVSVDQKDCSIAAPASDPDQVNVGLVTELGSDGICGRKDCYVPIDKSDVFGWSVTAGRIQLPMEACTRLKDGNVTAVRLATGPCQTKTVQVPTCGPWSSVGGYNEQSSAECEALCALVSASGCVDDNKARCFSRCYPAAGVCDDIISDYTKCAQQFPFSNCPAGSSETRTQPHPQCTLQSERFQVCRKCARAGRDECDYCTCSSCEKEYTACDADPACSQILACAEERGCRGKACDTICADAIGKYSAGVGLFAAIDACRAGGCQGKCGGA